jgi:hypothetical protein
VNHRARLATLLLFGMLVAAAACGASDTDGADHAAVDAERAGSADLSAAIERDAHGEEHSSKCTICHAESMRTDSRWREMAMSVGHNIPRMLKNKRDCVCCHLGEIRGFTDPLTEECHRCHENEVRIPNMAGEHCLSCHDFSGGQDLKQGAWGCQKCHASGDPEFTQIDVHGDQDCANCHRPHDKTWVLPRKCEDCHERQEGAKHGEHPVASKLLCDDCHRPHEKSGEADGRCVECHQKKQPEIVAAALFPGHNACTNCHQPHAFDKASAKVCGKDCHTDKHTMAGRGADKHANCTSCHSPHDVRGSAAKSCPSCHTNIQPHHGGGAAGQACTACHDPHPNTKGVVGGRQACGTCHEAAKTETAFHGGKARCTQCHKPHEFLKASVQGCGSCHAPKVKATKRIAKHSICTNCHVNAHQLAEPMAKCNDCHAAEVSTAPKGHAECVKCHEPHGGTMQLGATCQSCHQQKVPKPHGAPKNTCQTCHRPHGPNGPPSPPACTSCHTPTVVGGLHALTSPRATTARRA